MKIITDAEIEADILEFQERIQRAREKLALLPAGHLPYQEHKKERKPGRIAILKFGISSRQRDTVTE